jgi:hypothetical protein
MKVMKTGSMLDVDNMEVQGIEVSGYTVSLVAGCWLAEYTRWCDLHVLNADILISIYFDVAQILPSRIL